MKIEKIIAGIDFGEDSEKVLAYASFLSGVFGSSLNLLYVIDYLTTPPAYLASYIEEEEKAAEKKFDLLKKRLTESGTKTESEVVVGRLKESFERVAKERRADLIVLGFVSHVIRRSSSEKLIKGLQIPMLVVRGAKADAARAGPARIESILCPVDFSELSRKALDEARMLARTLSARLDILHVFPDRVFRTMKMLTDEDRVLGELHDNARENFKKFLDASGLKEKGEIVSGDPGEKIVSRAVERDNGLIVMGARGLGLIQGMLIGSVTDAVLKSSPCPVLVIH